jgi:hypothetical protein
MIWDVKEIDTLQDLILAVLSITRAEFDRCVLEQDASKLRKMIESKTINLTSAEVNEVCHVLTMVGGE